MELDYDNRINLHDVSLNDPSVFSDKIMSEIDKLTIDPSYKGKDQWEDEEAYKEHKRRKAAECLVPKNIRQDCIYAIHIYPDSNVEKQVKSWIVNSGLPIEIIEKELNN